MHETDIHDDVETDPVLRMKFSVDTSEFQFLTGEEKCNLM